MLFGTAWRAAPLLATECVLVALGSSLLILAYPLGFRAIVDGAAAHQPGRIVTGLVIAAVAFPGGWVLRLIGAALNAKMTDLANLRLSLRIGEPDLRRRPFLEHFERPEYLAEIDTLRERRRTLAGAPAQTLGWSARGCCSSGAAVLLALVWPPLLVVPLLAVAPALADRMAAQVEKRSDDELADRRRLLDELFSLASTAAPGPGAAYLRGDRRAAGPARQARRRGEPRRCARRTGRARGRRRLDPVRRRVRRGDRGAGAARRARPGLARRGGRGGQPAAPRPAPGTGASNTAGSFATASATADRLLWLEDYVARPRPATGRGPRRPR